MSAIEALDVVVPALTLVPDVSSADPWLEMRIWGEMYEDAQKSRIATVNRAERGGVHADIYSGYTKAVVDAENVARLAMIRCYRRVVSPELRAWQQEQKGIGEHLLARLLGHIGDPAIATPHHWEGTGANRVLVADEPRRRTVGQLWSYCGHGDPNRRRFKGMTQEQAFASGNPKAKMITHLLAEACMKQKPGNTYRDVYDFARLTYADRVHAVECRECGPSGKPSAVDTPWSKAHQHAAALRLVGKHLLCDLWIVAQR